MMVIGITGSSGSGKTTVAEMISEKLNAKHINADKIVRKESEIGHKYYNSIVDVFGCEILNEDDSIDRWELSELIYNNPECKKRLDKLTEKYIVPKIKEEILNPEQIVVLDVPLLFESGLDKNCDMVIATLADEKVKIGRICKRDLIPEEAAKRRLHSQPDNEFYKKRTNFIIETNGEDLEEQICIIIGKI